MPNWDDTYVKFDWAIKRLLRQKANFVVLEGFLTVFLGEEIKIVEILESEGNQRTADDKFNRVDIKAKNSRGEIIIIEIQNTREIYYLERIVYGVAKAITEHINLGDRYDKVKKVYSISILYFNFGQGDDYLYHGQAKLIGVHTHDELKITSKQKEAVLPRLPDEIFPEYILIRVNDFNKNAVTPIEEWMQYLKSGFIKENTTAPGLAEAKHRLEVEAMPKDDYNRYVNHLEDQMVQNDELGTARQEGKDEGLAEGLKKGKAEGLQKGLKKGIRQGVKQGLEKGLEKGLKQGIEKGREEERRNIAEAMKAAGIPNETIANIIGVDYTK